MPPDRTDHTQKTEELLQSYARRRREQAGPPVVLHPATRNLLQGEVTRTYRMQGAAKERRATPTYWLRLILGGAALAALLLGVGLWLRSDHEQELASARTLTNSLMLFSQSAPPGLAPASPNAGPAPERIRGFELALGGGNGPVLMNRGAGNAAAGSTSRPPDLAALPTEGLGMAERPTLPPESTGLSESLTQGLRLSERDGPEMSKVGLLVKSDPASPFDRKLTRQESQQVLGRTTQLAVATSSDVALHFQQVDGQYRQNFNSPPPTGVLRDFEIQRQGDTVRVVDADGSVYTGGVVQNGLSAAGMAAAPSARFAAANSQALGQNVMTASARDNASLAPFTFRAVGTNRTLNQVVEFTGKYAPVDGAVFSNQLAINAANNTAPPAQTAAQVSQARSPDTRASRAKALTQTLQQMPSNRVLMPGRIEGRATVGPRDALTIEAQQIGP